MRLAELLQKDDAHAFVCDECLWTVPLGRGEAVADRVTGDLDRSERPHWACNGCGRRELQLTSVRVPRVHRLYAPFMVYRLRDYETAGLVDCEEFATADEALDYAAQHRDVYQVFDRIAGTDLPLPVFVLHPQESAEAKARKKAERRLAKKAAEMGYGLVKRS